PRPRGRARRPRRRPPPPPAPPPDAAGRVATAGTTVLPAASAPLLDITGEHHAAWTVRLFAS
ncbi:hypothetical protein ACFVIN_19515, partial [Streptomyces prasinus]